MNNKEGDNLLQEKPFSHGRQLKLGALLFFPSEKIFIVQMLKVSSH